MKRNVLYTKDPLKHFLLVLENNLFDSVLSHCMDMLSKIMILVSCNITEVVHLLLQTFDLIP